MQEDYQIQIASTIIFLVISGVCMKILFIRVIL